jgi:hypothetical protein
VLWTGAAPFWLFEAVFCTADSLRNETAAFEALGWPTGMAFTELASRGILKPVDWSRDLKPATQAMVRARHRELLGSASAESVRDLIACGSSAELEQRKLSLVEPIATSLGAVAVVMPSSLKTWTADTPGWGGQTDHGSVVHQFLAQVAAPLAVQPPRTLDLMRRPGVGLPEDVLEQQRAVQRDVEGPMITNLIAGDDRFAGDAGYLPYFEALDPHRTVYDPVNRQLKDDWEANRDRLLRVRDVAEKHLWPQLHGDWIPRLLEGDPRFAKRFPTLVSAALRIGPLAQLLSKPAGYVVAVTSILSGSIGGALARLAELPEGEVAAIMAVAGGGSAGLASNKTRPFGNLALFYQKARTA